MESGTGSQDWIESAFIVFQYCDSPSSSNIIFQTFLLSLSFLLVRYVIVEAGVRMPSRPGLLS